MNNMPIPPRRVLKGALGPALAAGQKKHNTRRCSCPECPSTSPRPNAATDNSPCAPTGLGAAPGTTPGAPATQTVAEWSEVVRNGCMKGWQGGPLRGVGDKHGGVAPFWVG